MDHNTMNNLAWNLLSWVGHFLCISIFIVSLAPWLAETRPQSQCLPLQGPQTSVLQGKKSDLEFEQEFEQQIAQNKGEEGGMVLTI